MPLWGRLPHCGLPYRHEFLGVGGRWVEFAWTKYKVRIACRAVGNPIRSGIQNPSLHPEPVADDMAEEEQEDDAQYGLNASDHSMIGDMCAVMLCVNSSRRSPKMPDGSTALKAKAVKLADHSRDYTVPKFTDLLEMDFVWPEHGDVLFPNGQTAADVFIADDVRERLYHLTEGYKTAADLLVEKVETDGWKRNSLVYPIVFCYRQYIELSIKGIVAEFGPRVEVEPNWNTHDLKKLWHELKRILELVISADPDQDVEAVAELISEFSKIDPGSVAFRYPADRQGLSLGSGMPSVDIGHLKVTMRKIENWFMGAQAYLHEIVNR